MKNRTGFTACAIKASMIMVLYGKTDRTLRREAVVSLGLAERL